MIERVVIDTSVLIDFHNRRFAARDYVVPLLDRHAAVIHPVTAAELLAGVRDREDEARTLDFLGSFKRVPVKSADFESCLSIMAAVHLSHGADWPDCLIAATCIRLGLPLATLNDKHFRVIRWLKVVRPY